MKGKVVLLIVLIASLFLMLFLGCQSKEVTSAKVYIQQDNWEKAKEQLEQAVNLYPNDPEAHYLLGEVYGREKQWGKMNEQFDQSLAIGPKFEQQIKSAREKYWVNTFNAGVGKISAEDPAAAIEKFKEAIVIDPSRVEAYKNLAVAYMRNNDLEASKKTYQDYLEGYPKDVEVMQQLAQVRFELKEYDQVVELENKILEIDPQNVDAIVNIALAYDLLGQADKAISSYTKALELNPNDKDLLYNLGRLYFMNNDYENAIETFNKVIALAPDDYDANANVGNAYLQMADHKRKSLVDKENQNQTITKEERDQMIDLYCKALPYLEKAASLKDDNANLWNNLGVAYVNCGDSEKGEQAFKRAEEVQQ